MTILQYAPWASDIELSFYSALASLKINHDKLDDSARKVVGLYEIRPFDPPERSCRMQIHGNALTSDDTPAGFCRAEGIIKNVNTFEEFKKIDKMAVMERAARTIWEAIHDGTIFSCPSLLSSFSIVCFADLKKYRFTYHFNFPAIHSDPVWMMSEPNSVGAVKLSAKETTSLVEKVSTWRYVVDSRQHGFFLAKRLRSEGHAPLTPGSEDLGYVWVIGALSSYENEFFKSVAPEDRFICFADASTFPGVPAWPLRNLLILARYRWHLDEVQILCYRDTHVRREQANSILLNLKSTKSTATFSETNVQLSSPLPLPKVSGWERNEFGKLNNRSVDLAEYMNPQRLADQAVDLNLKLIKWRIAPSVNLDIIKSTSCLLLGAGTLGSYVARLLQGWGVRKITFVDNASVSFSNPVRQPLFDFKDCLDGGAKKALRAADALAEIYPGVDAAGHVISVPMAGHPIIDEGKTKHDFDTLRGLINAHDVVFLLMDTRESRWLPTVMAKSAGKIVMNAALGFDTFVVMRHGLRTSSDSDGGTELGCYFCNDVVAPANSLKDATLDQQCTVTRPGIAPIASALLVELLVSILQHPLGARAPASNTPSSPHSSSSVPLATSPQTTTSLLNPSQTREDNTKSNQESFIHPLGALPHQLRGFLSTFSTLSITGSPFPECSACGPAILSAYETDPWGFVQRALNERGWVEEISGLAEVQRRADEAEKVLVGWGDDGEEEVLLGEGGGDGELI